MFCKHQKKIYAVIATSKDINNMGGVIELHLERIPRDVLS